MNNSSGSPSAPSDAADRARVGPGTLAAVALLLPVALVLVGPVPSLTENGYLLPPYRLFHPGFIARDWTFGGGWDRTWLFNHLLGAPLAVLPLEAVGWLGRVAVSILILAALFRIGRRFDDSTPAVILVLLLWLCAGQALVGGEVLLPFLAPNTTAWACLLLSIDALLADRDVLAAALLGVCFSLHPAVGLSAFAGVFAGLLALGYSQRRLLRLIAVTIPGAMPGIIGLVMLGGARSGGRADWAFQVLERQPYQLDPFYFRRSLLAAMAAMVAFTCVQGLGRGQGKVSRFVAGFELGLVVVFVGGVTARWVGRFELLRVFPFRLLPVVTLPFFGFALLKALRDRHRRPLGSGMAALTVLGCVGALVAIGQVGHTVSVAHKLWQPPDDLTHAFEWVARNTPEDAILIVPPIRRDARYRAGRAITVSWAFARMDSLTAWRERIVSLVGPQQPPLVGAEPWMEARFNERTEAQIDEAQARFGGDYLVSAGTYSFPVLYDTGTYRVYRLTPPVHPAMAQGPP